MVHPMGESKRDGLRVDFDRRLKLEFHGSKITSDGGFLAYRELDDALGLSEVAGDIFQDSRIGKNGWHSKTGQFRLSVFGRHGRYVTFQLAEVAVSKNLFQNILALIDDLRRRPIPA